MDGLIILFSFFLIRTFKLKFRLAVLNLFLNYKGVSSAIASCCTQGRCSGLVCQQNE